MRKHMTLMRILAATLLLGLLAGCAAQHGPKQAAFKIDPAHVPNPFHTLVDIEFVKPLVFEAMLRTEPPTEFMIIDSRPKKPRFDKGHIPTAVSLPDSQFDKMAAEVLPADKNTLLVFYCGGTHCPLSHQSAWKAEALGYTNVAVYPAGDPEWVEKGYMIWTARDVRTPLPPLDPAKVPNPFHTLITIDQVKPYVARAVLSATPLTDVIFIDSRPQHRYDKGHIPTAVSLPDSQFDKMAAEALPADKNTKLIFYCGGTHCPLSHQSAWKAEALGYTNVAVYPAGDPEWVTRGYVLWTADGPHTAVAAPAPTAPKAPVPAGTLKSGAAEGTIDNDYFVQLMRDNPGRIQLIDVRSPAEFAAGHIPSAINMPVDILEDQIAVFSTAEKPIVFICAAGGRSGEAFYLFQARRPELKDVYYVDARISFAPDGSFEIK